MSAAMSSPGFVSFGSMPYDDVYLEDGSSEEEDEHVISDSRKPLMSPSSKGHKVTLRQPQSAVGVYPLIKKRILRWLYVLVTAMFIGLMVFVLVRIAHDAMLQAASEDGPEHKEPPVSTGHAPEVTGHAPEVDKVVPCSDFAVEDVWVQNFPKLITETAFRLVDVNRDGVLDVIIGFSTGVTSYFADQYIVCDIYFNGTWPCFGGLMALDGRTGAELWRQYTTNEVFAVNCNADVDRDGVNDCLGGGRAGTFELVSGASGRLIWTFKSKELLVSISNFYTPQFIRDVDGDGIQDVLNIHGGDPLRKQGQEVSHIGILVVVSGATGHVITWMEVPDKQESYYSPQIYYQHGGKEMVLFGSGGEAHGGSLWVIAMADLLQGDASKVTQIYTDSFKGVMTPPALADITGDGVVDIVMAMFNSTVVAFDGQSYSQLWNHTFAESETYSTPGVAYYNDDNIPDFMVSYNHGPGYPVYFYSQVTILDGRTGRPLLTSPIQTAGSSQVSPLAISVEGLGNDAFIYFVLDCLGHEADSKEFHFSKDDAEVGIGKQSRSDFCKQRFNSKDFSHLSLLNRHMTPPGQQIYNSIDRVADEYKYKVNSSLLAKAYLAEHPNVLDKVREIILEGLDGHDQDGAGSIHSAERGDQGAGGSVQSDRRIGGGMEMGEVQKRPLQGEGVADGPDPLDRHETPAANKQAPRLGFDDEDEIPFFNPPVDSQPVEDRHPQSVDPQPLDPERTDPHKQYQQRPNPQDFFPRSSYPQNPHQPAAKPKDEDAVRMIPVPGDEDESDSGISQQLLDKLLNQLLQDDQLRKRVDQQPGNLRGYSTGKSYGPRGGNSDWGSATRLNDQGKKSYYDDTYDTRGDTENQRRYYDEQGYKHTGGPYARYDDTDRDEINRWLDRAYRSDFPGPSKRSFRTKRDAATIEQQQLLELLREALDDPEILDTVQRDSSSKHPPMPIESINNELFTKLSERHSQRGTEGDTGGTPKTTEQEQVPESKPKKSADPPSLDHSKHQSSGKSPTLPVEYLINELFLKLESRETGEGEPIQNQQGKGSSSHGEAFRQDREPANPKRRLSRHAGPHDAGGVQRLISTGTLAPVLLGQDQLADSSIDLIFATYWFYPADTQIILPEQQTCIDDWLAKEAQRLDPKNVFYGMDHDAYEHMATDKCTESGSTREQRKELISSLGPLGIYPFNIHTGELTVYRLHLTCRCGRPSAHQRCAKVLPYDKQGWAGYMGTYGNSHFLPRD